MNRKGNQYRLALGVVGVVAALAAGGLAGVRVFATQSRPAVTLTSVWVQSLARDQGVTLLSPASSARVTRSAALSSATSHVDSSSVREAQLAQVTVPNVPMLNNRLCWVVSVLPHGGTLTANGQLIQVKYDLVFIDANTGKFIIALSGGPAVAQPSAGGPVNPAQPPNP